MRDWVGDKDAERGRPRSDPVVFFKLQLILFFEGLRSERKRMDTVDRHVAQRWFLGFGFEEPLPDHSRLTRSRQRLGVDTFGRLFDRVVELCQEAGLVWGKERFFDGTKVQANADIASLTPRFAQAAREHAAELFGGDAATADTEPATDDAVGGPTPLERASAPPAPPAVNAPAARPPRQSEDVGALPIARSCSGDQETDQRLAAENRAQWQLFDEHRLDPDRPPAGSYRRVTDCRVSTTDPDAAPIGKGAVAKLG